MSLDRTQHQSTDELRKARDLSLEPTRPPAQIPGYKLLRFIGSGAYGEVWLANDLKTGRRVAIKFYTRRSSADIQLLAREVEKLVVLSADRYVVQLLDVGWDADPPFYVMDFVEHGSLEDRLKDGNCIPTSDAIELFQEIANGMMHLHGKGILHCDLKPGNVLLDQDGKPRVADFGQSRLSTEQTSALGTLFYMAPEQSDLKAIPDARWDVYGLGALLFSMLTGKPPYYSPELATAIEAEEKIPDRLAKYKTSLQAAEKPTAHRSIAGVDRAMADIIDRCIAADPKKRFNNIQSLLLALRQRELSKARKPLMILGLLGPILLLIVMSLFGWWAFRQAVNRTQTGITMKAIESNQFAAQLAARSAAEQIDEYFRVVGQLSRNEEFLTVFGEIVDDQELKELRAAISNPNENAKDLLDEDEDLGLIRQSLRSHPLRKKLQPFLEDRLNNRSGDFPLAASWFVNDRYGNQIASAFRKENKTLANNYSFRSYFTGLERDLKTTSEASDGTITTRFTVNEIIEEREIIQRSHLSAVFISEQSNTWKVAFSAPIIRNDVVEGVVAVTVDLGNLIEFDNFNTHYAMMVDTRDGEYPGIILEHPLFQQILSRNDRIPNELAYASVDLDSLENDSLESRLGFLDPVGATVLGKSAGYDRRRIVATAPVTMDSGRDEISQSSQADVTEMGAGSEHGSETQANNRFEARVDTKLVVLAVEDYESIVRPAKELSRQLGRLAVLASLFLLGVTIGLWAFVRRMLAENRQRLERAFSPTNESSALEEMETIAVNESRKTV